MKQDIEKNLIDSESTVLADAIIESIDFGEIMQKYADEKKPLGYSDPRLHNIFMNTSMKVSTFLFGVLLCHIQRPHRKSFVEDMVYLLSDEILNFSEINEEVKGENND